MKTSKYLPLLVIGVLGAFFLRKTDSIFPQLDDNMPTLVLNNWQALMQLERNPDVLNAAAATFDLSGFHRSAAALRSKAASIPVAH